jgi:hypothetical protein
MLMIGLAIGLPLFILGPRFITRRVNAYIAPGFFDFRLCPGTHSGNLETKLFRKLTGGKNFNRNTLLD